MERELRRLHREIAMLRQEFENPGMEDIFSGIGYILGLFGVAFFVAGHRERQRE
jgi:nickel transport protein